MTIQEAISILEEHNKWRRGEPPYDGYIPVGIPNNAMEVGIAIDVAVKTMKEHDTGNQDSTR